MQIFNLKSYSEIDDFIFDDIIFPYSHKPHIKVLGLFSKEEFQNEIKEFRKAAGKFEMNKDTLFAIVSFNCYC